MKNIYIFLLFVFVYLSLYGIMRWRKILVMHEYYIKEDYVLVRHVHYGYDVRVDTITGSFKNFAAPIVYYVFIPCVMLENHFRGGRERLP